MEKITSKDLMIGDFVNVKKWNSPIRISSLDEINSTVYGGLFYDISEDLEPIPLTDGFLMENFPRPDTLVWYLSNDGEYRIENGYDLDSQFSVRIKYVHQLQHILYMFGIEKKIIL